MERSHRELEGERRATLASVYESENPEVVGPLLSGLLSLLNSLLEQPDIQTLIDEILASTRQVTGASAAYFFSKEGDDTLHNSYHQGVPLGPDWGYLKIGSHEKSFASEVACRREIIHTADITKEPYYNPALHDPDAMGSFLGAPIIADGELYGVIELMWQDSHECVPIEYDIIRLSAERIAQSHKATRDLTQERTDARLIAALGEITQNLNNPDFATDTSLAGAYSHLQAIGDALQAKAIMMYTGTAFGDSYGDPVHVLYDGRECDFRAPFEVFKKFVDGGDGVLSESLQNDPLIMAWAEEHFGVTLGRIVSDQPAHNTTGCIIFGRAPSQSPLTLKELEFLRDALLAISTAQKSNALRLDEGKISRTLQQALVNRIESLDGFTFDTIYQSATSNSLVGGDFYGAIELPDNKAGIILGDISGKGVDSASLTYLVKNILASYLISNGGETLDEALETLNRVMVSSPLVHNFASMYLLVVDHETGKGEYCCAGHPPACLRRADGTCELLEDRSPIVGALDDLTFEKVPIELGRGDVLFFYTDGSTEARSPNHEFFGEERVIGAFKNEIEDGFERICDRVYDHIVDFAGGKINDDLAMLAVRFD